MNVVVAPLRRARVVDVAAHGALRAARASQNLLEAARTVATVHQTINQIAIRPHAVRRTAAHVDAASGYHRTLVITRGRLFNYAQAYHEAWTTYIFGFCSCALSH